MKLNRNWKLRYANDNDAYVPEMWAQESLMVLEENLIAANLVHRDFENEIRSYGDIVNTRRPGQFTARRKVDTDAIVKQQASSTNVQIPLNQHVYTSFPIYDVEASKSFKDLVSLYLTPAVVSVAKQIDNIVLANKYAFLGNAVGKLGTAPTKTEVLALQTMMDNLLVPDDGRICIVTPTTKGDLLKQEQFTDADKFGDGGSAIRNGSLGRLYGTQYVMSNNNKTIAAGNTVRTGAVNLIAGYAAGTTTLVVDGFTGALVTGSWCTIAGDPQRITAHTETSSDTTGITISPGLRYAVDNDAVIKVYTPAAVNLTAGYAAGYAKTLVIDGTSVAIQNGQLITVGTATTTYGALPLGKDADGNSISMSTNLSLDKPLADAAANDAVLGIGPAGNYNWAFHRNAVALVTRPLALPPAGSGVRAAIASYNGLSLRIVMGYDKDYQAMVVTVDTLVGTQVLDTNLGAVMLG